MEFLEQLLAPLGMEEHRIMYERERQRRENRNIEGILKE